MYSKNIYSNFINNNIEELLLLDMASTSYHVLEDSILKV